MTYLVSSNHDTKFWKIGQKTRTFFCLKNLKTSIVQLLKVLLFASDVMSTFATCIRAGRGHFEHML